GGHGANWATRSGRDRSCMKGLEKAESWLDAANFILANTAKGRARFTVAIAQSIHALIKANDALSMRFLGRRSTRHEDAAIMFGRLIKQDKVDPKYAQLRPPPDASGRGETRV